MYVHTTCICPCSQESWGCRWARCYGKNGMPSRMQCGFKWYEDCTISCWPKMPRNLKRSRSTWARTVVAWNETQDWPSKDDCNLFKGFHGRRYYHCKSRIYLDVAREMNKNPNVWGWLLLWSFIRCKKLCSNKILPAWFAQFCQENPKPMGCNIFLWWKTWWFMKHLCGLVFHEIYPPTPVIH